METVELREALAAGRGEILDLSQSRHVRPRPPDLMIGAVTPALMRAYFTESLVHGATVLRVREAEVLREGAILLDGRFALCGQINVDPGYPAHFHADLSQRRPTLPVRRLPGEVVLLAGAGHTVYGHWLVDFLPKLYLLHRAGYRLERLRFLLPDDTPGFARAWLAALGIGADRIVPYAMWEERLACAHLVVPGALRHASRAAPLLAEARTFLLERLGIRRPRWRPAPRPRRRLLVARAENAATRNRRRLAERALLAERAGAHGFETVRPEALPIADQVGLFRSAGMLVGEYGSGLHGSFFAEPGATVLALRNGDPHLGFLQSGLDHVLGHASGYVIGTEPDAAGLFSVAPRDIDAALDWLGWARPA